MRSLAWDCGLWATYVNELHCQFLIDAWDYGANTHINSKDVAQRDLEVLNIIENLVESCIAYGLSAALYVEITLEDGRVVQSNFDDYPIYEAG